MNCGLAFVRDVTFPCARGCFQMEATRAPYHRWDGEVAKKRNCDGMYVDKQNRRTISDARKFITMTMMKMKKSGHDGACWTAVPTIALGLLLSQY